MPGSEDFVQRVVHTLEAGAASVWLRRTFIAVVISAVAVHVSLQFSRPGYFAGDGSGSNRPIDCHRPRLANKLCAAARHWAAATPRPEYVARIWTDVYNAPLPPLVNAVALFPFKSHLHFAPRQLIYLGDRIIAGLGVLFFFASLLIQFFLVSRLFDRRLAVLCCTLAPALRHDVAIRLVGTSADAVALSFQSDPVRHGAGGRGEVARYASTDRWLAAVGAGFGLLALSHGLTIWMFVPALLFIGFFFQPRLRAVLIVLGVFLVLYAPWLIRNWVVCGNPLGLGFIRSWTESAGTMNQAGFARSSRSSPASDPRPCATSSWVIFPSSSGRTIQYLGGSIVAAAFFFSTLHRFRRPEIGLLRWFLLALWLGAVVGMALFGLDEEQGFSANQLHLLFVPIMTAYGLAWLLLQWSRLGFELRLARIGFLILLLSFSARFRWPIRFTAYYLGRRKRRCAGRLTFLPISLSCTTG